MIWDLENHREAFPHSAVFDYEGRLYGCWMIGNNYKRKVGYHGEYPPSYLERVYSLFPRLQPRLHVFSGSVQPQFRDGVSEVTLDSFYDPSIGVAPSLIGNAENLGELFEPGHFGLVLADPPYSKADCQVYGCTMPNKAKVMREIRKIIAPDGVLCWLDVRRPMYRREDWIFSGMIAVDCGTNRRVRALSLFRPRS